VLDNSNDAYALRDALFARTPAHIVVRMEPICEGVWCVIAQSRRHGTFRIVPTEYHLGRMGAYYVMPHRVWPKTIGALLSFLLNPTPLPQPNHDSTACETPSEENLVKPPDVITLPEIEF